MVAPIESLLGRGQSVWTSECTAALNRLVQLIFVRLQLGLADVTQPFVLHTMYTPTSVRAVLLQTREGVTRPVALIGRRLKAKEPHSDPFIAEVQAALWAVRALARYTQFASRVDIIT